MEPRIQWLSLLDNKTRELWSSFMPRKKEVSNAGSLISLQLYDAGTDPFDPATVFTKWAGVIVPVVRDRGYLGNRQCTTSPLQRRQLPAYHHS